MPAKTDHVKVTEEERVPLESMRWRGTQATRKLNRARLLLQASAGLQDAASAAAVPTQGADGGTPPFSAYRVVWDRAHRAAHPRRN